MNDSWPTPDPTGWGAPRPPGEPPRPPRAAWWAPLAAVIAVALAAGVVAVVTRSDTGRPVAAPTPVATTKPPKPTKPPRSKPPKRSPAARPVATYSAPSGGIPVTGRVLDTYGRPVAGAGVSLTQRRGFFESLGTALIAVGTLGIACVVDDDVCETPYGEGRTGADGRFTVHLEPATDDYAFVVEHRGKAFAASIDFANKALRLPDVTLWGPVANVERGGTTARVRFPPPPSRLGSWKSASLAVSAGDEQLMYESDVRSGHAFDLRMLEDERGEVDVTHVVTTRAFGEARYSAAVPVRGTLRPVSRGSACTEISPRSGKAVRHSPCRLTDGDRSTEWATRTSDRCKQYPCTRKVVVDLRSVRRVGYVGIAGCHDVTAIQHSADGRTWRTVHGTSADGGDGYCGVSTNVSARYVRVSQDTSPIEELSEISIF